MISYAQASSDVVLNRGSARLGKGFIYDIGGYHPERDSVTKHFYDQGWHGINVEPGANYYPDSFVCGLRPTSNLQVASAIMGVPTFYEMDRN